jgi:citrate/tricarballylate utilization protein
MRRLAAEAGRAGDDVNRTIPLTVVREGERLMRICNACRYCEGFCAVFPAMERRLDFSQHDITYLANLCHDCGECYYSCQYAPPHEFSVNVPLAFAKIRRDTYRHYAWPGTLSVLFTRNGLAMAFAALIVPALFVLALRLLAGPALLAAHSDAAGSFYEVMSYRLMVGVFGAFGLAAALALVAGLVRFWRDTGESWRDFVQPTVLARALSDSFSLRYLDGGGDGCAYPADTPSHSRRWGHHLTFYGFLLCCAATSVAAFYENVLGWSAPYPLFSVPVVLGSVGGVGLLAGPLGLLWLKGLRNPDFKEDTQTRMDVVFVMMLFLTSMTGFLLLALRESAAMGTMLGLHLGVVLGLFATMPYGKFVHGIYRFCALSRNAIEERRETGGASRVGRGE